jgi:7-cyano-7-deazaguanine reductase
MKHLGKQSEQPTSPNIKILDKVKNNNVGSSYVIRLTQPEFTCLCPITGQPDFAHIVIDYIPNKWIVESKSLKLFFNSYRDSKSFHENTTMEIVESINKLLNPVWIRIGGYWYPRGGIPIDIFWQNKIPPKKAWVPDQEVTPYRGRG